MVIGYKRWKSQKYLLNKMDFRALLKAYFTYPAIQVYFLLFCMTAVSVPLLASSWIEIGLSIFAAILVYPLVWYLLHRFVLHGKWLYKMPWTSALWKRIHFDHHLYPNDLSVLFGGLHTTLPTLVIVTGSLGWLIGGLAGALAAFGTALITTCFYEFVHCIQHLAYQPKNATLKRLKKLHLAHHFHNENGNYGITNFLWDRLFQTLYKRPKDVPASPTVRNLGYTGQEAKRYPWVARLTDEIMEKSS